MEHANRLWDPVLFPVSATVPIQAFCAEVTLVDALETASLVYAQYAGLEARQRFASAPELPMQREARPLFVSTDRFLSLR